VTFPFNAYALAVVGAFFTSLAALPMWRKWCLRTGLVDEPGQRKIHEAPIPLAGGLTVMTGLLVPTLIAAVSLSVLAGAGLFREAGFSRPPAVPTPLPEQLLNFNTVYFLQYGLSHRALRLGGILLGVLGMLAVGLLDDKHELRPAAKFTGQFLVASLVAVTGTRITLFIPNLAFSYAITVLWILTVTNAFNFMDNMNGLCAGLGAIGAWCFAAVAAADGQYLVALMAFLAFGSLLGFLPHNFPRARAFLGDAGSHLVGYLLAVLAILPHFYSVRHPRRLAVLTPLVVLAVPLLDMVWVVLFRWRIGQPFYQGDTNHLSHRLVRLGLSRTSAVLLIWLAAALIGSLTCLL
jgi:UDP-GlcNAc:undecaprenyl-phosphate GlcNAc-1-phosphate transferase